MGKNTKTELNHIHESLRHLAVPLGELAPDPENAREHSLENIAAIRGSLAEFGQDQPLVVQQQGMVVRKGNGRLEAARQLGWSHVAALIVDEGDVDATARAVADNRASELAAWDVDNLSKALDALSLDNEDLQGAFEGLGDLVAQATPDGETEIREIDIRPPPSMTWVLIGIPTVRYGEISETVEHLSQQPEIICEVTANDDNPKEEK